MPRIGTVIREVYRRPGADALPAHLEERYGIRVTGTTRLDAGVVKIDHEEGPPWVARLFVASRPVERAEGDAEVLRFVERRGIAAERCAHPEPVSTLDGRAVIVTRFVDGKRPPSTPAARRRLGELLGRIHTLPTEPGAVERPAGSLHHLPEYEGAAERDLAAAHALLADLDGRVPAKYQQIYDELLALLPLGDGGEGLPTSFLHPDPARVNVIAEGGRFTLVDWTGAGRGPRLASLAVLLQSAGAAHVDQVLAGYSAHTSLTEEELDRLEGVLWLRPIWLACWQCWLAVVSSKVDRAFVPKAAPIAALAKATRAAARP